MPTILSRPRCVEIKCRKISFVVTSLLFWLSIYLPHHFNIVKSERLHHCHTLCNGWKWYRKWKWFMDKRVGFYLKMRCEGSICCIKFRMITQCWKLFRNLLGRGQCVRTLLWPPSWNHVIRNRSLLPIRSHRRSAIKRPLSIPNMYCQNSNISGILVGYQIVDQSDAVEVSPGGAAPTTSSFAT